MRSEITTTKILSAEDRDAAMDVIRSVYRDEKRWIADEDSEIPAAIAELDKMSWFMVSVDGVPAGAIRVVYDPPLEVPPEFQFQFDQEFDLEKVIAGKRFVEIGRFMILPKYRKRFRVVLKLMKAAIDEVVRRGYTHLITDVFESDPHSPLHFHTRVLGFERVGTHQFGELNCNSVRIILVLDIARAYQRLKTRKDRVFRELSSGITEFLEAMPVAG